MSESPHKAAAFPRCHLPFKLIVTVQRTSLKGGDKVESSDIRMDGDTRAGCAHLGWMRVDDAQRGRALHLSIALLQITCRRSTSHMFSNNHVFFNALLRRGRADHVCSRAAATQVFRAQIVLQVTKGWYHSYQQC